MIAARQIARPAPGFWLLRQVKGGPLVPAAIVVLRTTAEPDEPDNIMDRSPFIAAFIAGEPVGLDDVWFRRGEAITKREYEFRVADLRWAQQHAPDEPQAQPRKRIDLMTARMPF